MTRNKALSVDVVGRLKASDVTDYLPDGADNIHPGPVDDDRDEQVSLIVKPVGGGSTRRGPRTQRSRLVQVKVEVAADHYETLSSGWFLDVFDVIEETLEGIGGPNRAPAGAAGGISPQYDSESRRYIADTTHRYTTIN